MQSTTPRFDATFEKFERTLPREFFSKRPPIIKPSTSAERRTIGIVGILAATFLAAIAIIVPHQQQPKTALTPEDLGAVPVKAAAAAPTSQPVPVLPELRRAEILPAPARTNQVLRAQLLHIRGIGTVERDQMPDGRILTTRYMGELTSAANLPRSGAQLGDMWFTRNDRHCWVLAPVNAFSQSIGWVDP